MEENKQNFEPVGMEVVEDEYFVPLEEYLSKEEENKNAEEEDPNKKEERKNNSEAEGGEDKNQNPSGQGRQKEEDETASGGTDPKGQGSPTNTPSSIALALKDLKEVGALRTLDDTTLEAVKDGKELNDIIDMEVENRLKERMSENDKFLLEARSSGMPMDAIQYYEQQTKKFNEYDESLLDDEGDNGEKSRRWFITMQYKLKGYSDEDIKDLVDRSFDSGKDVEDSKKALTFCREYFDKGYKKAVAEAKENRQKQMEANKQRAEALRTSIMEGKGYFDDLKVDKGTREKIYDYIGKPEHELKGEDGKPLRDADGRPVKISGLTKYVREHTDEANSLLATILVLTDEGKNFSKLFKGPVKEKTNEMYKKLEDNFVNATRRTKTGQFAPQEGVSVTGGLDYFEEDPEN